MLRVVALENAKIHHRPIHDVTHRKQLGLVVILVSFNGLDDGLHSKVVLVVNRNLVMKIQADVRALCLVSQVYLFLKVVVHQDLLSVVNIQEVLGGFEKLDVATHLQF